MSFTEKSSVKSFGGQQKVFTHDSRETKCSMTVAVYLPPQALAGEKCPVLYFLSGLTCTEANCVQKGGFQRIAAEKGIIVVGPDTSPRGCNIAGEDDSWDFGSGAGFYLDATVAPWADNYRMFSYVSKELPALINANFPVTDKAAITGHSMGGHGALICALKNPGQYTSVSAFAAIANPTSCPWGEKAFKGYLGGDESAWKAWDASALAAQYAGPKLPVLADTGTADGFLKDGQLRPEALEAAAAGNAHLEFQSRMQDGYDHSYFFIATFIEKHLNFHAKHLRP